MLRSLHREGMGCMERQGMTEETVRRVLQVHDPTGLHIRPAAALAEVAAKYNVTARLRCGDREADVKSVLEMLTLGAVPGSVVELVVSGADAERAAEDMCRVWQEHMGPGKSEACQSG